MTITEQIRTEWTYKGFAYRLNSYQRFEIVHSPEDWTGTKGFPSAREAEKEIDNYVTRRKREASRQKKCVALELITKDGQYTKFKSLNRRDGTPEFIDECPNNHSAGKNELLYLPEPNVSSVAQHADLLERIARKLRSSLYWARVDVSGGHLSRHSDVDTHDRCVDRVVAAAKTAQTTLGAHDGLKTLTELLDEIDKQGK